MRRARRPDGAEEVIHRADGWLVVAVAGGRFAMPIPRVREVVPSSALERMEAAPEGVCGTALSQGRRVPVVDLHQRFDLPTTPAPGSRIVVLRSAGRWFGLAVDAVVGLTEIRRGTAQRLPPEVLTPRSQYFAGTLLDGEDWLILLDVDRLLAGS